MISFADICTKYPVCEGCPLDLENNYEITCNTLYELCVENDGKININIDITGER